MAKKIYNAPSRTDVRKVHCPLCMADRGEPCIGHRGKIRASNHLERAHRFLRKKRL